MAAQLTQLPVYLGAVWKRKMRHCIREVVQPIELAKQSSSTLGIEGVDEFPNRLRSIGGAEVDSLEVAGHFLPYIGRGGDRWGALSSGRHKRLAVASPTLQTAPGALEAGDQVSHRAVLLAAIRSIGLSPSTTEESSTRRSVRDPLRVLRPASHSRTVLGSVVIKARFRRIFDAGMPGRNWEFSSISPPGTRVRKPRRQG